MKTLKKMFAFTAVFAVIGLLTSCTEQELVVDETQVDLRKVIRPGDQR